MRTGTCWRSNRSCFASAGVADGIEGKVLENIDAVIYVFDVEGDLFVESPGVRGESEETELGVGAGGAGAAASIAGS